MGSIKASGGPVDWDRIADFVYRVIRAKFNNLPTQVVEDCRQITLIHLLDGGLAKARDPENLDGFVATAAINLTFSHIRKYKIKSRPRDEPEVDLEKIGGAPETVEDFVTGREFARWFITRMRSLPGKCRSALYYYFRYKTGDERYSSLQAVCSHLDINLNSYASDVKRCLARLQEGLRERFDVRKMLFSGALSRAALDIIVPALEEGGV